MRPPRKSNRKNTGRAGRSNSRSKSKRRQLRGRPNRKMIRVGADHFTSSSRNGVTTFSAAHTASVSGAAGKASYKAIDVVKARLAGAAGANVSSVSIVSSENFVVDYSGGEDKDASKRPQVVQAAPSAGGGSSNFFNLKFDNGDGDLSRVVITHWGLAKDANVATTVSVSAWSPDVQKTKPAPPTAGLAGLTLTA